MGLADPHGPATSDASPPPWWTVDGIGTDIPLESLETGPLPDGSHPDDIKKLQDLVRSLARENRLLRERLEQELKHRYGSHSEKRKGGKGNGPGDPTNSGASAGLDPAPGRDSTEASSSTNAAGTGDPQAAPPKKPGHGRRPIPPNLPRDEVPVPLDDERCQRCHGPVHRLERVESYRFDYVPGHIRVRVYVRWRCACNDASCDAPFRIATLPPEPIPKGRATAGFLAHLLVTKFADHCPLYRFRKILLRQKVDLPASTLVDYCKKATELLKPLWGVMRQQVLDSAIVRTDDTHVLVRLPRKKGVLKGHLWAYQGDEAHPYVVFEFTPNWEGKAAQDFLATFKGYIQADAYKGYDALFKDATRIEVGCWAHVRRKWVAAEASSSQVAGEALDFIRRLYAIEKECKDFMPDQRRAVRQERSAPILEKLRVWMETQKAHVLPKSPVAAAIEYAQNQWVALTRFLGDGRLEIDNNAVERELRGVALGRKNWMAAGSELGGETAAIGYTMISSALACGVDPVEWLRDVLDRIVTCPPDRLQELLPDRWRAARDAARSSGPAAATDQKGNTTGTPTPATSDLADPTVARARPEPAAEDTTAPGRPAGAPGSRGDPVSIADDPLPASMRSSQADPPIGEPAGSSVENSGPLARGPP